MRLDTKQKDHKTTTAMVCVLATLLLHFSPPTARASDEFGDKLSLAYEALENAIADVNTNGNGNGLPDCVLTSDKSLFNRRNKNNKNTISYTHVVIFEAMRQNEKAFRELDPKSFVAEKVLCKYLDAYRSADKIQRDKEPRALAPMGSLTIEADSFFAETFHNNWGKHDLGHADVTRAALLRLNTDAAITELCDCKVRDGGNADGKIDDTILISRASQTPDLYRWSGKWDVYHAHTDDFTRDVLPQDQTALIEAGKERFIKYVAFHAKRVLALARSNAPLDAAFHLGVVAHMIQDLIYHHGISLRQHSGLAYLGDPKLENPDFPPAVENGKFVPSSKAAIQFDRAITLTFDVFKTLLMKLEKDEIKALISAAVNEKDFNALAEKIYSPGRNVAAKQDMNIFSLASYYNLHTSYESVIEYGEQETITPPERDPTTHLIPYQAVDKPWDADKIGGDIKGKIDALD